MAQLQQFSAPGFVVDFPDPSDPTKITPQQAALNAAWSANINRWISASQFGDVWDLQYYGPRPNFYNPLLTGPANPADLITAAITWGAFPGRFSALFPNDSDKYFQWGDQGNIPNMTEDLCSQQSITPTPYTPTGPRGWQDEYCEWSVQRDANGNITSVMFTCENPEYWITLWSVDPNAVLGVYQKLVNPNVQLNDLSVTDSSGNPIIDPVTNQPVYNPLNKWNSGTQTLAASGGAMHLTSSPNTLGAEFDLAAAATIPRVGSNGQPVTSALPLVCCARYGRAGRNSDPTIGQNVNAGVNPSGGSLTGILATLANPPGLYMQMPQFNGFQSPDGTPVSQFWTVNRGSLKQNPNDIDRILHATFAVPASKGYTVSDITVNGQKIQYGSQIVSQNIFMALEAWAYATGAPNQPGSPCTNQSPAAPYPFPAASALQSLAVFQAQRTIEMNANEIALSIPILALPVQQGTTVANIALLLNVDPDTNAQITVQGGGVTVTVTGTAQAPGVGPVLVVTIVVDAAAALGDRGVIVNIPGSSQSPTPSLGLLTVVPPAPSAGPAKPHFRRGRT